MKKPLYLVFALLMVAVGATVAQDVRYDYDKDKDFTKYHTYKWVTIKGADQADELTAKRIIAAVDSQLVSKGFAKTDGDNADFYIGYQTALTMEKQFTSYNTGWTYGPGWGAGWYGHYGGIATGSTYGTTSTIYVGQLDISIYDPSMKQLIWRGEASKTLDPQAKPEKTDKEINKAVQKLLKTFPPKPKK